MDLAAILTALQPTITSFLRNLSDGIQTPTAPTATTKVSVPNAAIKDLQTFLNAVLKIDPPLVVDGWLGPKTDAAIEQGIALLKTAGFGK